MLMRGDAVLKLTIEASDGEIGSLDDLLIEDDSHQLRWLVVDVGSWLAGRRVLLPPGLCRVDEQRGELRCSLDKERIEASPPLENDLPVSRQYERTLVDHYGVIPYWSWSSGYAGAPTPTAWPPGGYAESPGWVPGSTYSPLPPHGTVPNQIEETAAAGDPHLRSVEELQDYRIQAEDDSIGHIEDLIVDVDAWRIRYFVINTRNWLPGGDRLLLSPTWFSGFDYYGRQAHVDLTVTAIKACPAYEPGPYGAPERAHEKALHEQLDQAPYW